MVFLSLISLTFAKVPGPILHYIASSYHIHAGKMLSSIALLSAFVACTIASPVERRTGNKAFTVPQVSAGIVVKSAPAISMLQTYAKYSSVGASAPAVVVDAAASAQSGTVAANPEAVCACFLLDQWIED